jgi:hypothetical protein
MSVPLITLYLMAQALIGLVLVIFIWYLRLRNARTGTSGVREYLIWIATLFYSGAVVLTFLFFYFGGSQPPPWEGISAITLACLSGILSLLGKGSGRWLIAIASFSLALPWLLPALVYKIVLFCRSS